jgi:hypothetical protein
MNCGDVDGTMRCVELIDPCDGETFEGRCAGDRAIWCERDIVNRVNCSATGQVCGDVGGGQMRCLPNPCRGITWVGRCLAGSAVWCHEGEIKIRVCSQCGQRCGWSDEYDAYYCID